MPSKHTKNVVLTDHHKGFVDRLLKSGRYQNASEVMREGLRALEDRIKREEADLTRFQSRVRPSPEQLDRGESTQDSVKQIFDQAFANAKDRREP